MSDASKPWLVLIGGEHWKTTTGERWLGHHCSVRWIGRAYEALVDHFGRENIIVMTQLTEVHSWLREAARHGLPLFTSGITEEESAKRWSTLLREMEVDCRRLLEDGVHYEGKACNPGTVLDVLAGNSSCVDGPVLPQSGSACAVIGLYSHGWSHTVYPEETAEQQRLEAMVTCDLCGQPHTGESCSAGCPEHSSLRTREWYMHMPHEVPEERRREAAGYGHVCTLGHEHPFSLLYSTQLMLCLQKMFEMAPSRPVVVLHNYCGSGGALKWMRQRSYQTYTSLRQWPLAMVSSSAELEGAIPGLLPLFCRRLAQWFTQSHGGAESSPETIAWLFDEVRRMYQEENPALDVAVSNTFSKCLMCSFAGREETLGFCSVCHKKYESLPVDEQSTFLSEAQRSAKEIALHVPPQRRAVCALDVQYGNPAFADVVLEKLFPQRSSIVMSAPRDDEDKV
mmetsp:Transcript_31596/g.73671  ORF Transcript_31596/g.73671 Transcript_31596/m.73671 type:complete len:453 (-) Transcript_31596:171-1529(-)